MRVQFQENRGGKTAVITQTLICKIKLFSFRPDTKGKPHEEKRL